MEPSLSQIDDYYGNESKEKRRVVNVVIIGLFLIGFGYGMVKYADSQKAINIYTPIIEKVK